MIHPNCMPEELNTNYYENVCIMKNVSGLQKY